MDYKAQSSVKRDGIPPEREAKRLRPTEVDNSSTLSPDLWSKVLECKKFVFGLLVYYDINNNSRRCDVRTLNFL